MGRMPDSSLVITLCLAVLFFFVSMIMVSEEYYDYDDDYDDDDDMVRMMMMMMVMNMLIDVASFPLLEESSDCLIIVSHLVCVFFSYSHHPVIPNK